MTYSQQPNEPKLKSLSQWATVVQSPVTTAANSGKYVDTFQKFKQQAKEKEDRRKQMQEAQEKRRRQKEAEDRERARQEKEKQREKEEEEALERVRRSQIPVAAGLPQNTPPTPQHIDAPIGTPEPLQQLGSVSPFSGSSSPSSNQSARERERARLREQERRKRELQVC